MKIAVAGFGYFVATALERLFQNAQDGMQTSTRESKDSWLLNNGLSDVFRYFKAEQIMGEIGCRPCDTVHHQK